VTRKETDVVVIGAGSAGSLAARDAARAGLRVLLVDKRNRYEIGKKLTYDTLPAYICDVVDIEVPKGDEVDMHMEKLKVFAPGKKYSFEAPLEAYLVDRLKFGQRLLGYALEAGAELFDETEFYEPIVDGDFVQGVRCRNSNTEHFEVYAKVVIDASGFERAVSISLPDSVFGSEPLDHEDIIWGYREIRDIIGKDDTVPPHDYPGWYCYIENDGYAWVVPESSGRGNIGCGLPLSSAKESPENITKRYCEGNREIFGEKIYEYGTGPTPYLPIRTCQPELAGNGFMVVGDAAYQASPVSAFGMAASMVAGREAASAAVSAIKNGDCTRDSLWKYNVEYKRNMGANQAFIDPMCIFIQNASDSEIETLIRKKLIGPYEFSLVWTDQVFTYSLMDLVKKFFLGFPHIFLLLKLNSVYGICKKMEKLYRKFPERYNDFEEWNRNRRALYFRLFRRLGLDRKI